MFFQHDTLQVQVLESKYDGWKGLLDANTSNKTSTWWRHLYLICGGKESLKWFDSMVKRKVGNGENTFFFSK